MFTVKNVANQVRGHHDKMALTKTNTSNDTKHVQHHDATEIQKNYIFVFFVMVRYQIWFVDRRRKIHLENTAIVLPFYFYSHFKAIQKLVISFYISNFYLR